MSTLTLGRFSEAKKAILLDWIGRQVSINPMQKLLNHWNQFWFRPSSGRPEAFFRIAYTTVLLLDVLGMRTKLDFLFSNQGLSPHTLLDPLYSPIAVHALYWFWIVILVALIFGFFTRAAAACNFLLVVYFFGCRDGVCFHAADWVLHPMAFYLLWMTSNRHLSLDRWRHRSNPSSKTHPVWPVRLAQIHFALMYFSSGLSKLADPGWMNGSALQNTLMNPFLSYFDFSWIPQGGPVLIWANYAIIIWEIAFPFLLVWRRTRRWALVSAVIFHLGIASTIRTAWFGEYFLSFMLLFIDDVPLRTPRPSNAEQPVKNRWTPLINLFLCFHLAVFLGSQTRYPIPFVNFYARYAARIQFFNVWPSAFFLTPVRFLFLEAVHADGSLVPLPPFNRKGEFAPGIKYVKEARGGFLMFRIAAKGLSEGEWKIYIKNLIQTYREEYGNECPREIRVSLIQTEPDGFGPHPKALRVPKRPILTAKVICGKENPEVTIKFL